jgi:phosphinothricin acetyltransferase
MPPWSSGKVTSEDVRNLHPKVLLLAKPSFVLAYDFQELLPPPLCGSFQTGGFVPEGQRHIQSEGKRDMMRIRDAVETDLPAIIEIYNSTIPYQFVTADLEPVTVESRLAWFLAHEANKRPLWVVESEGQIFAWLGFQSFYGRPAYETTAELSIYVSPDYRYKGLGKMLLQQAIAHSPSYGIKTLLGFIFAENYPSLQLFEQFGFQRWGYLPKVAEFGKVERDLVIVGLRLD